MKGLNYFGGNTLMEVDKYLREFKTFDLNVHVGTCIHTHSTSRDGDA